jgi:hypothetical protein
LKGIPQTSLEALSLLAETVLYRREPLELVKSGKLYIRTKAGEIKPFIPNFAQKIVLDLIEKRIKEGKPVRIRLLKARQLGFSTLFEAIIYAFTAHREGFHSLVIANDEDLSKKLFDMNKLFHERLPDDFKPTLKKSNEIALEFDGLKSKITIDTSRNKDAGRGSTYQIVHKAETARFHFAKEVNLGIANAVADLPGTMVFDETTANGMNFHYDDCQKSIRCEDGYDFVFIPWFFDPEYKMPAYEFVRTDEEVNLCLMVANQPEAYRATLTDEQLQWRRFTIAHKCGGDVNLFMQEYPSNPEEAFIFSGRPRFDINTLRTLKINSHLPIAKDGLLDIYEPYDPFSKYIIGVDTSEGLITGDNSSAVILNCKTYSTAAHYSGKMEPDLLASYLKQWGDKYNNAMQVIESNNHGLVTIKYLKEIYKNLYTKKVYEKISDDWTEKVGFQTNARTKPLLIANLDKALRSGLGVFATQIIDELMTYVIEDDGTTNASEGKKDDSVIALALAVQGYLETSEHAIEEPKKAAVTGTASEYLERIKNQRESKGIHRATGMHSR